MLVPVVPPRLVRRVVAEGAAAVIAPVQLLSTLVIFMLPVVAVVVADLERTRSTWCGVDLVAGRSAAGSWSGWVGRRVRSSAVWRIDVPIAVVSMAIGMIEAGVLVVGGLATGTMLLAPAFYARGIGVVVGPIEVKSWAGAWLMTATSVVVVVAVAGLLVCGSFLRDAAVRALGRTDALELRRQLESVRGNRARLVEDFEGERRRIERDLHDGVQQDLLALTITLGLLEHACGTLTVPEGERIQHLSSRAHSEADLVTTRLRDIVRGIHPRELTDHGLLAGVAQLCTRSPLNVDARFSGEDSEVPLAVASALYYALSELLTNISRHSGVDRAVVDIRIEDCEIVLLVADDGLGGVTAAIEPGSEHAQGTGLSGLRDRLAGVDGTLAIDSPTGAGTTVTIRVPRIHRGHFEEILA